MKILHVCAGWQQWNGAANIARMLMDEQRREGHEVSFTTWASVAKLRAADEVWIHCGWLPCLWWAALVCFLTQRRRGAERVLKWMPEACYDPVRLRYHGWKKWLAGPIERWCLRRCAKIVATCEAEKGWIQSYLGKHCPPIEVTDIKRFFNLNPVNPVNPVRKKLHLLYLVRRHPLKGLEFLEAAVKGIEGVELRVVSNAFGEEKEKVWEWCDVLVLPTLSENFGLVIAEALERGKRVITTDGAPAWNHEIHETHEKGVWSGYGGRLIYLKGYRDGTKEQRVELLKKAMESICK